MRDDQTHARSGTPAARSLRHEKCESLSSSTLVSPSELSCMMVFTACGAARPDASEETRMSSLHIATWSTTRCSTPGCSTSAPKSVSLR